MPSASQIQSFRRSLSRWFEKNGRDLPWRHTRDPYAILVSEIMLQQTQVATVQGFYQRWLKRFPTLKALAAATENEVLHAWQGLGYYTRARNLHSLAKSVVSDYDGTLPSSPELLRNLPGIGRYTANAVATFAFNQTVPIVEANITRVIARLFNIRTAVDSTAGSEQLWNAATALVPRRNPGRFNSALMDLGALICVNGTPKCNICPVHKFCHAPEPELLPVKRARKQVKHLTESHRFTVKRGRILLEHCSRRWRGMWMLPSIRPSARSGKRPVHTSVFPFTHHQITLRVFRSRASGPQLGESWIRIDELDKVAIPSPHRRAIQAVLRIGR